MPAVLDPRKRNKIVGDILRAVRKGKTFFLSGHMRPDGDTVGSELAFSSLLRRIGKKVDIVNYDPVPQNLLFLPGASAIKTAHRINKSYDVAVIFECSGSDRMGNIIDLKSQAKTVINIDHHAHHSFFGDINLINPDASSNSEQLYYFFERARMKVTRDEAMALFVGLVTDTGRFQQENCRPESHRVASELLKVGIPVADISRRLFSTRSPEALKLLGKVLSSLRLEANGRVAILDVSLNDFAQTGAGPDDTDDVINYGLMIPSVEVAMFFRETEEPGQVKVSLRGKGRVDLMKIAVSFGGGGHRNAAGCTVSGPLNKAANTLLTLVLPGLKKR